MKIFVFVLSLLVAQVASAYTVTSTSSSTIGALTRDVWSIQAGSDPLDHFEVYRVYKTNGPHRGAMAVPNPLGFDFGIYEYADGGVYANSFAGYIASQGYDVWGYSGRGFDLNDGDCLVPALMCPASANWGFATIIDDMQYVRSLIMSVAPPPHSKQPAIGGLSLGAMSTIAVINAHPTNWSGAFIWEGGLYTDSLLDQLLNVGHCTSQNAEMAAGVYAVPLFPFKDLALAAEADLPGARAAFVAMMNGSAPLPLPNTLPFLDYIFAAAPLLSTTFTYASSQRMWDLFGHLIGAYAFTAQLRDVPCSLAGATTFTGNLGAFGGRVLAIGGERGFGQAYTALLGLMSGALSKSQTVVSSWGHVDHFANPSHLSLIEAQVVTWLDTVF